MDDPERWLALAHAPGLHAGTLQPWLAAGSPPPGLLPSRTPPSPPWACVSRPSAALRRPDPAALNADLAWLQGARPAP